MNKIEYLNLGGLPIAADADAAEMLENYLMDLDQYFGKSEYAEEIISDIELRMAELIEEKMGSRKIANIDDVRYAINVMGTADQFDDGVDDDDFDEKIYTGDSKQGNYNKKLYRDPQEKVIAGVCAGVSAYFGIQDPIWLRLAIVVFTLTGGAGIILYLILWAIMPEARTSIDRLRMKGEPVDLKNIERIVENGFDHISSMADKMSEKFTKKKW
ncbi:PspC domain-containing protein [Membranihabitans marinus]|uniref:PspC domain-containing protein n=1 Tax=Membranihabitans marinus TaxID=1227546 RepID=UPI001F280CD5|nr:PspC domain-containing protein [Membranihabitans marinus]